MRLRQFLRLCGLCGLLRVLRVLRVHRLLRHNFLLNFDFRVVFNGFIHVGLENHFQRNAVPNAVQNALLDDDLQLPPIFLHRQGRNAALKQVHVGVKLARAMHVHLVNEVVQLRHVNVHLLLFAPHSHAGQALELNDVHARHQIRQVAAPAAIHDALRLLLNDGGVPFRHARKKVLKRHQVLPGFVVGFAQFPRLVKNGPKPFGHHGR